MTEVQQEIAKAVAVLGLSPAQFVPVPDEEAKQVYWACLREFVTVSYEPRWWWEHLREPCSYLDQSIAVPSFQLLPTLVPVPDGPCYFIAEDNEAATFPIYVSTPRIIALVIAECFGYEYYITPLDKTWLIGENHHDRIFGVGEPIVGLLKKRAESNKST
jgi:hypothetical protein